MAWGRRTTSANTRAWSQDDYHAEFADKIREQIKAGVTPWTKALATRVPARAD